MVVVLTPARQLGLRPLPRKFRPLSFNFMLVNDSLIADVHRLLRQMHPRLRLQTLLITLLLEHLYVYV